MLEQVPARESAEVLALVPVPAPVLAQALAPNLKHSVFPVQDHFSVFLVNQNALKVPDCFCFQRMESLRKTISGTLFFFMHLVRIISIALLMNMKSMCIRRSACDKIIFF